MCIIKFTDAVRTFDGNGDFGTWCRKFEASASICGVDKLGAIPLLLEGRAFELYAGLPLQEQENYDAIKAALSVAFGPDPRAAYDEFRNRKLRQGESIDEFVAALRRLAAFICQGEDPQEHFIKQAFLAGLPTDTARHIASEAAKSQATLQELIPVARSLLRVNQTDLSAGEITFLTGRNGLSDQSAAAAINGTKPTGTNQCFRCGKTGHMRRECRMKPSSQSAANSRDNGCFVCGSNEHRCATCPQWYRYSGNE